MTDCISKAHELLDEIAARPEFDHKKGVIVIRLPIHCGGIRRPEVSFEGDVLIRAGLEIVRCERC